MTRAQRKRTWKAVQLLDNFKLFQFLKIQDSNAFDVDNTDVPTCMHADIQTVNLLDTTLQKQTDIVCLKDKNRS